MTLLLPYRPAASFVVAAIFFVFNIGLPIVIASCPMTETPFAACGICKPDSDVNVHNLTTAKNTSCCVIVFAPDKNSTEFVQAKSPLSVSFKTIASLPVLFKGEACSQSASSVQQEALLPPKAIDIPILISSLLI